MVECASFYDACCAAGIEYFIGVPDSLLKVFCAYLDRTVEDRHQIAANEGGAVGLAIGHYLATGKPALVYMQNSGQGNAVNPLLSLCDPKVYGIPMVLLVGWRGEPGIPDEPQHAKQGEVTEALFEAMDIPCSILAKDEVAALEQIHKAVHSSLSLQSPVALMVRKGTFASPGEHPPPADSDLMRRAQAVEALADALPENTVVVSTTGHISRELYSIRHERGERDGRDFLMVGGMGHASQVALGLAVQQPERQVFCLDGDGAALMHMGGLALAGQSNCTNLKHIVLNNGAHGSVGGQPTVGMGINFSTIAEGCGYTVVPPVDASDGLSEGLNELVNLQGPAFLEIRVSTEARSDLPRPDRTPAENLKAVMDFLRDSGE